MTKAQALKLAVSRWGVRAMVHDGGPKFRDGTPRPNAAEREVMQVELTTLRATKPERPDVATFGDARSVGEFREALREYGGRYAEWKKRTDHLMGCLFGRRYDVGEIMQMLGAFHVRGSGDTWEEAFEKAGVSTSKAVA